MDRDDIANGFSGKPNPAWDSLPADRREDLARRGATFAAMVAHLDRSVGLILADLQQHGGCEQGYALHLVAGKPAFDVRINGKRSSTR